MRFNRESAVERAKQDLTKRTGIEADDVKVVSVADKDFPDMSLGAAAAGEMAAQMISSGWQIVLSVNDKEYEYRADKYQLRLHNFNGSNHVIESS